MLRAAYRPLRCTVMSSDPAGRTPSQRYAAILGRLRAGLRAVPVDTVEVLALARALGREAHAADHSLSLLIDVLSGVAPPDACRDRMLPRSLVDAGADAYLTAADGPEDVTPG